MHYHKFDTHSQLHKIVLGTYFPADYFDFIEDRTIRQSLMKIAKEINEDLTYFEQILKTHNVEVLRPSLPSKKEFAEYTRATGKFLSPPLQPRNFHTVIGNKIYQLSTMPEVAYINAVLPGDIINLTELNQQFFKEEISRHKDCYNSIADVWYCKNKYLELAGPDWPNFYDYVKGVRSEIPFIKHELESFKDALCYETKEFTELLAPNLFPVDNKLYVDCKEYFDYHSWVKKHIDFNGEIIILNSKAAHSDGYFVVLGNNVIIGIVPGINYEKIFPGYRVVKASDSYLEAISKRNVSGLFSHRRWWVLGEEDNSKLIDYVDTYMQNFIGNAYETLFDLNVLAINKNTICMIQSDPVVVQQLNSYGINVIEIPWRHRFFVDCGLHCLTLDLYRED